MRNKHSEAAVLLLYVFLFIALLSVDVCNVFFLFFSLQKWVAGNKPTTPPTRAQNPLGSRAQAQQSGKKKSKFNQKKGSGVVFQQGFMFTAADASIAGSGLNSMTANTFTGAGAQGLPGYYNVQDLFFQEDDLREGLDPGAGSYATTFNVPAIYQWVSCNPPPYYCCFL